MDILDKVICYAVEAHSGATRKGGNTPYIVHPLEAAAIAATLTDDREIVAAAVLHDTVEDTDTTDRDICNRFGARVAALVAADSENKRADVPPSQSWRIRKRETLDRLEHATRDEQIIVLADKLSNIRSLYRDYAATGDKVWEKFNQKDKSAHAWYYKGIAERLPALVGTVAYKEYAELCNRVFDA